MAWRQLQFCCHSHNYCVNGLQPERGFFSGLASHLSKSEKQSISTPRLTLSDWTIHPFKISSDCTTDTESNRCRGVPERVNCQVKKKNPLKVMWRGVLPLIPSFAMLLKLFGLKKHNPQFTPDAYPLQSDSDLAAEPIGFHFSQCVCSHCSGPSQLRQSGALRSKYTGLLLLPDTGCKPYKFRLHGTGSWEQKRNKAFGLLSK